MNKKGIIYENIAVDYLRKNGYEIIERNFSVYRVGEIDIIAKKDDWLIFVEVRARKKTYYSPFESVNKSKSNKIIKTSAIYLKTHKNKYNGIRYDVVSIEEIRDNDYIVEHIEDAFNCNGRYYI